MFKFCRVVLASLMIGLFSLNASAAAMPMHQDCTGLVCWTKKLFVATADIVRAPFDWAKSRWGSWDSSHKGSMMNKNSRRMRRR